MKDTAFASAQYDFFMKGLDSLLAKRWRKELWSLVEGPKVLEAGVGTGLNIHYYRPGLQVIALDINKSFIERAELRAQEKQAQAEFVLAPIEDLPFRANSFDSAVTTFLFCQLRNPHPGLSELYRVLKPGGQLLMLEHVRSNSLVGRLMTFISGPLYRLTGDNVAGNTEAEASAAGFINVSTIPLFTSVVKIIMAEK